MKRLSKRSILFRWTLSYIFILLIPLFGTIFIYNYNIKVFINETERAKDLVLNNLSNNTDELIQELHSTFLLIYTYSDFKALAMKNEKDAKFFYDAFLFNNYLITHNPKNINHYIWIYLREKDYFFSTELHYDSHLIYETMDLLYPKLEKEDLFDDVFNKYVNRYYIAENINKNLTGKYLINSRSFTYGGSEEINIIVGFPLKEVEALTKRLFNAQFVLLDKNGYPVASFSSGEENDFASKITTPLHNQLNLIIENDSYTCSITNSKNGYWQYALITPTSYYTEQTQYARFLNLACITIAFCLGLIFIIYFLKLNYKPVSSILELLKNSKHSAKIKNEFECFHSAYKDLYDENNRIKNSLKSSYLLNHLKGRNPSTLNREYETFFDLEFCNGSIILIGLSVRDTNNDTASNELAFFSIDNVFSELMNNKYLYRIEDGDCLFYLFQLTGEDNEPWITECEKNLKYLCEVFSDTLDYKVSAGISRVVNDFENIYLLYDDIMEILEYQLIIGEYSVTRIEELQEPDDNASGILKLNTLLQASIEKGDVDEAGTILQTLFNDLRKRPYAIFRLIMLDSINKVIHSFYKMVSDANKHMQLLNFLDLVLDSSDIKDFYRKTENLICFACKKVKEQWDTKNDGVTQKICDYVNMNYTDINLNVSSLATALERNPKYLVRVFKEETGEGLLQYITGVRVRKAQEIIKNSVNCFHDIYTKVGFANMRTFVRAFSKIVGMTPAKYFERTKLNP